MALWRSPVRPRYGPLMYYIYILHSKSRGIYYVGHTDSLSRRIEEHNKVMSKYTRNSRPWKLVYSEEYATRSLAMNREVEIKRKKNKKYIEGLLNSLGERPDTPKV